MMFGHALSHLDSVLRNLTLPKRLFVAALWEVFFICLFFSGRAAAPSDPPRKRAPRARLTFLVPKLLFSGPKISYSMPKILFPVQKIYHLRYRA